MGEMPKAKIDRLAGKIYLVQNSFSPKKHLKVTFSKQEKSALAHFAAGRHENFTKGKWKLVKNGHFLLFGLQLEKEERYCDGA